MTERSIFRRSRKESKKKAALKDGPRACREILMTVDRDGVGIEAKLNQFGILKRVLSSQIVSQ
jgi:hypothetical protein